MFIATTGNIGSKVLALALVALLSLGMAGCKTDSEKNAEETPTGGSTPTPPTGGSTGGGTTPTANRAPILTGTPITTAKTTVPYSFQPVAKDADGDALTFTIAGKPDWASFSTSTGRLQGTPPADRTGTYSGVQITVSDGKLSTAMPAFSISVVPPAIGSAELAWQPPTTNEDGTPLADLSGYVIRFGKSGGALDQSVKISNPGMTMYVVENLTEGTWYFSLSSVNGAGVESRPTGYVSKTIS
jgi:hypothetical protein